MKQYSVLTSNPTEAATIISAGRVVAFPTGTSYGLAVDALQGFALRRLRNLKQRSEDKSFTICLDPDLHDQYLALSSDEKNLLKNLSGQPLTLLVNPREHLAHLVQDGTIGLRTVDHILMSRFTKAAAVPLTATSANVSGQEPCQDVQCLLQQFPGRLNETTYNLSLGAILDGGTLPPAPPTTIARIQQGGIDIIRPGSLTQTDLQTALQS